MKTIRNLCLFAIATFVISCDLDDEPSEPLQVFPPAINAESNFQVDQAQYDFTAGLRSRVAVDGTLANQFVLAGNGISLVNGNISGTGPIVQLVLYNASRPNDLSGTYQISDTQTDLTASLDYAVNFNAGGANQDPDDGLVSGTIEVTETTGNQYLITITNGVTETGQDPFSLYFEGGVLFVN